MNDFAHMKPNLWWIMCTLFLPPICTLHCFGNFNGFDMIKTLISYRAALLMKEILWLLNIIQNLFIQQVLKNSRVSIAKMLNSSKTIEKPRMLLLYLFRTKIWNFSIKSSSDLRFERRFSISMTHAKKYTFE